MIPFVLWLVVVEALGLAALPLTMALLPRLADRGYGLAKLVGILLVTYLNYLLGSIAGWGNNALLLALGVAVLFAGGIAVLGSERATLRPWFGAQRTVLIVEEAIFLILFVAWALYRANHPGILSTEKPMDLALMTASHRATSFPPYDPWLSGHTINYYYGGYLAIGTLVTLTGVAPAVGYNLALALLFALVGVAAYAVAFGLMRDTRWALLGTVFVVLVGNLDGLAQLFDPAHGISGFQFFNSSRVVEPTTCSGSSCTITEFPAFSFLLGDLHPHVMALPFTILTIGIALNLALAPAAGWRALARDTPRRVLTVLLSGLAVGALYVMNSWDWPAYLLLCVIALLLPGLPSLVGRLLGESAGLGLGVAVLSWLLYISFRLGFVPQYSSFGVRAHGSPTVQVFMMFGLFLLPAGAFIIARLMQREAAAVSAVEEPAPAPRGASAVDPAITRRSAALGGERTRSTASRVTVVERDDEGDEVNEDEDEDDLPRLPILSLPRLGGGDSAGFLLIAAAVALLALFKVAANLGTVGFLLPFVVVALYLAWREARVERMHSAFALLLCAGGMGLIIVCDLVYLKDNFCGATDASGNCIGDLYRMNTVFKFYYQAWTVLALGGAYALYYLASRLRRGSARYVVPGAAVILAAAGGVYLLLGLFTPSVDIYTTPVAHAAPTLDGSAYLDSYSGQPITITNAIPADAAAIRWLDSNVPTSGAPDRHPVILEADQVGSPPGPQEYWPFPGYSNQELMMSRIATFSGLPTVLGWGYSHEGLWHGDAIVGTRFNDVRMMYTSADPATVERLLRAYRVSYVYIGQVEDYTYYGSNHDLGSAALERFKRVGAVVYNRDGVVIIRTRFATG